MIRTMLLLSATIALLLSGAIFGFFYAWVCSTMWGLDAADPGVAVAAMQAMNASVRNAVFAPAFFGTPFALALTALIAFLSGRQSVAIPFFLAAVIYVVGAFLVTMAVNVPMNENLAAAAPDSAEDAAAIWAAYSPRWQVFNHLRTVASGVALLLAGYGIWRLGRADGAA